MFGDCGILYDHALVLKVAALISISISTQEPRSRRARSLSSIFEQCHNMLTSIRFARGPAAVQQKKTLGLDPMSCNKKVENVA